MCDINFSDISVFELVKMYSDKSKISPEYNAVVSWFLKYNIRNYQELSEYLYDRGGELGSCFKEELSEKLRDARRMINHSGSRKVDPLYTFSAYECAKVDLDLAQKIDTNNKGNILHWGGVTSQRQSDCFSQLSGTYIGEVKTLLGVRSSHNFNNGIYSLFPTNYKLPLEQIVNRIDLYDESVIRMLLSGELSDGHFLLEENLQLKMALVEKKLSEIVEYVCSRPSNIWGINTAADFQKLRKLASYSGTVQGIILRKKQLVRNIALLMSLEELANLFNPQELFCLNADGSYGSRKEMPVAKLTRVKRRKNNLGVDKINE